MFLSLIIHKLMLLFEFHVFMFLKKTFDCLKLVLHYFNFFCCLYLLFVTYAFTCRRYKCPNFHYLPENHGSQQVENPNTRQQQKHTSQSESCASLASTAPFIT